MHLLPVLAAFGAAFLVASLVEYLAHRAMHRGWFLVRRHANHHRTSEGQGVLPELVDYAGASLPLLPLGLLVSRDAGVGFAAGGLAYAFVAAWIHQLHHERPDLVLWMQTPIHRAHHDLNLTRANFGLVTDLWDRVFGTYLPVPRAAVGARRPRIDEFFRIRWGWASSPRSPWRRTPARRSSGRRAAA